MEYISTHKRLFLILFVFVAVAIPLLSYVWIKWINKSPQPGSCLILEEKYCKMVQFIPDPNYSEGLLAAYKVPGGTVILSPIDGSFSNTPNFLLKNAGGKFIGYPGVTVISYKNRGAGIINTGYGFIFFKEKIVNIASESKKGEIIGIISDKNIDRLGNFNLLVRIAKSNNEGEVLHDSDILKMILESKK